MVNLKEVKLLYDKGEYEEAKKLLIADEDTVWKQYQGCVLAGRVALALGQTNNAKKYLEQAVELDESKMAAWAALSELFSSGNQQDELLPVKKKQLDIAKEKANEEKISLFTYELGIVHQKLGNYVEALNLHESIMKECESSKIQADLISLETQLPSCLKLFDDMLSTIGKVLNSSQLSPELVERTEKLLVRGGVHIKWIEEYTCWCSEATAGLAHTPLQVSQAIVQISFAECNRNLPNQAIGMETALGTLESALGVCKGMITDELKRHIQETIMDHPLDVKDCQETKYAAILMATGYLQAVYFLIHEQLCASGQKALGQPVLDVAGEAVGICQTLRLLLSESDNKLLLQVWELAEYRAFVLIAYEASRKDLPTLGRTASDLAIRSAKRNVATLIEWDSDAQAMKDSSRGNKSKVFAIRKVEETAQVRISLDTFSRKQVNEMIGTTSTLLYAVRGELFTLWRFVGGVDPSAVAKVIKQYQSKESVYSETVLSEVFGTSHLALAVMDATAVVAHAMLGELEAVTRLGKKLQLQWNVADASQWTPLLGLAWSEYVSGNFKVARELLENLCGQQLNASWAIRAKTLLGRVHLAQGLLKSELESTKALLGSAGTTLASPAIVVRGVEMGNLGKSLKQAVSSDKRLDVSGQIASSLFSPDLMMLGKFYRDLSKIETQESEKYLSIAFEHFVAAAKLDPSSSECFLALGEYYLGSDRLPSSPSYLEFEMDIPSSIVPRDKARALKCFEKSRSLNPMNPVALLWDIRHDVERFNNANDESKDLVLEVAKKFRGILDSVQHALFHQSASQLTIKSCASWVWMALGQLQLHMAKYEPATVSFQKALTYVYSIEEAVFSHIAPFVNISSSEEEYNTQVFRFRCWQRLGEAYMLMGRNTASLRAFLQANEIATATAEIPTELTLAKVPKSLHKEVIFTWSRIGTVSLRLGRQDDALEYFSIANIASPKQLLLVQGLAESHLQCAQICLAQGRLSRAALHCHQGIKVVHQSHDCVDRADKLQYLYGHNVPSLRKLECDLRGILATALPAGIATVDESKTVPEMVAEQKEMFEKAKRAASQACWLTPWEADAWQDLATLSNARADQVGMEFPNTPQLSENDIAAGSRAALSAVLLSPTSSTAWNVLGVLLQKSPESESAVQGQFVMFQQHCFVQSLNFDLKNAEAWLNLAFLLMRYGRLELAKRALAEAQSVDPSAHVIAVGHAMLAEKQVGGLRKQNVGQSYTAGSERHILASYQCAIDAAGPVLDPASLYAIERFSRLVLRFGHVSDSHQLAHVDLLCSNLIRYTLRHPNNPGILNMLGVCFEFQGKLLQAAIHYAKCYEIASALEESEESSQEHSKLALLGALNFVRCLGHLRKSDSFIAHLPIDEGNSETLGESDDDVALRSNTFHYSVMEYLSRNAVGRSSIDRMIDAVNNITNKDPVPWLEALLARAALVETELSLRDAEVVKMLNDGAEDLTTDRLALAQVRVTACASCYRVIASQSDARGEECAKRYIQLAQELLVDVEYLVASMVSPEESGCLPFVVSRSVDQQTQAALGILEFVSNLSLRMLEEGAFKTSASQGYLPFSQGVEMLALGHNTVECLERLVDTLKDAAHRSRFSEKLVMDSEILLAFQQSKLKRCSARARFSGLNSELSRDEVDTELQASLKPLQRMVQRFPFYSVSWLLLGEALLYSSQLVGTLGEDQVNFAYVARNAMQSAENGLMVLENSRATLPFVDQAKLESRLRQVAAQGALLYGANSTFSLLSAPTRRSLGLDISGDEGQHGRLSAASKSLFLAPHDRQAQRDLANTLLSAALAPSTAQPKRAALGTSALGYLDHLWQASLKCVAVRGVRGEASLALQVVLDGLAYSEALLVLQHDVEKCAKVTERWKPFVEECGLATSCLERLVGLHDARLTKALGEPLQEVYAHYRKLLHSRPNDVFVWMELGTVLEEFGNKDAALKCFRKAAKSNLWHCKKRSWMVPKKSRKLEDTCKMNALILARLEKLSG